MDNNERAGGPIGVQVSVEAIEEVKVQTNVYSAEAGRTAGAVIEVITKSGTNTLHGSLFEFMRNDKLDARNYFSTVGPKPTLRQNQFGGSLSGPIKKNKTFFFEDYEGLRIVQQVTPPRTTVPTACERGRATCNGVTQLGSFSDISAVIYDPTSAMPCHNNIISASRLNPISKNLAALYPSPNMPGFTNNYIGNPT